MTALRAASAQADDARGTDRIPVACPVCGEPRMLYRKDAERCPDRRCMTCLTASLRAVTLERQAYLDEMAVERLLAGMPVNSTRAERQAAVAALTARRLGAAVIADRLRISRRTVERLRARERVAA